MYGYPLVLGFDGFVDFVPVYTHGFWVLMVLWVLYLWSVLGYPLVLGFEGFVSSVVVECVGVPTGFWVFMVLWVLYLWSVLGYPLVFGILWFCGFYTCGMCWGTHWFGF